MSDIATLKSYLSDRHRRLTSGKLYKIKDKSGQIMPFIPNLIQLDLIKNLHNRNIILKARQLGFTTLIDIILLDACLWGRNISAGIIAQDLDSAEKIFQDKIKFVFDNLPPWLRSAYDLKTDRSRELAFTNNGSRISVSTSFRGGTYQYVHVSEFGKICNIYPLKSREIITGTLNTVDKDGTVFIESTAEGNSGYFFEMCQKAQNNKLASKVLTKLDYKFHFYPWYESEDYVLSDQIDIPKDLSDYFVGLDNQGITLSSHQKNRYAKTLEIQGEDIYREYPSTSDEAFRLANTGAYYASYISSAYQQNRVRHVAYEPSLPINTAWDLGGAGGGDETAIRYFQVYNQEIRLIDFRSGNGYSMTDIIHEQVFDRPYKYGYHLAPHDIRVHEYSSGKSRFHTALELGLRFEIVSSVSISDGIHEVRNILPRCRFDEVNTSKGLKSLANYQREYDEKNGMFRNKPLHNQHSNAADAFRMLAVGLRKSVDDADHRLLVGQWTV